jgi:CRP/FNR family transcriptional regulator
MDAAYLSVIRDFSLLRTVSAGNQIFSEGEPASGFFVVLKGRVKVFKLSISGEERILHVIHEGGALAEAVLFSGMEKYPAFAEALTDSELLYVPRKLFLDLMKRHFDLSLSVLASLSEKLRFFNSLIEELSLKSASSRLAKYFLDTAIQLKSDQFDLDIKKNELAARLGIVPETFSRVIRKMSAQRILRLQKKHVSLLNRDKLERLSSGEPLP